MNNLKLMRFLWHTYRLCQNVPQFLVFRLSAIPVLTECTVSDVLPEECGIKKLSWQRPLIKMIFRWLMKFFGALRTSGSVEQLQHFWANTENGPGHRFQAEAQHTEPGLALTCELVDTWEPSFKQRASWRHAQPVCGMKASSWPWYLNWTY